MLKSIRRRIHILVIGFLLILSFTACSKTKEGLKETEITNNVKPPVSDVILADDGSTEYKIVYDSSLEEGTVREVERLVRLLSSKLQVEMTANSDLEAPVAENYTKEILVGYTNRSTSEEMAKDLREGEYRIAYDAETDCVAIVGGCVDSTRKAVEYFIKTYLNLKEDCLSVPGDLVYEVLSEKQYEINSIAIQDVYIRNYNIVVPANCDKYTEYTAYNLSDYIRAKAGITISVIDDSMSEEKYEILIGKTNRAASAVSVKMGNKNYFFMQNGSKIVMQGNGLYVGAGVGAFVTEYLSGDEKDINITDISTTAQVQTYNFPTEYKNAILMIGDGMGYNHVNMALANGMKKFYAQDLPYSGNVITRSQSVIEGKAEYTDSAAAGTAMATGYKTYNDYLGMDKNGKAIKNVRELAYEYGAKTAVLTTDDILGATPSAFLCHNVSRGDGTGLKQEQDKLTSEGKITYSKGNVGDKLFEETREALSTISDSKAPFFAMIEEGYIDKCSHNRDASGTIMCVERFNDCVAYVIEFIFFHPDTALIITADHETGGITRNADNEYGYHYTSGNHTNQDVPLYAFGAGTSKFNKVTIDNTDIARFIAKAYGATSFGQ